MMQLKRGKCLIPRAVLQHSELCFLPWDTRSPEQWASWRRVVTKQKVRAQTTQGRLPMPLLLAKTRLGPAVAGWRSQGHIMQPPSPLSKSSPSGTMTQHQIVAHVWLPVKDAGAQELETSGQVRTGEGVGRWKYWLLAKHGWLVSTFASPRPVLGTHGPWPLPLLCFSRSLSAVSLTPWPTE